MMEKEIAKDSYVFQDQAKIKNCNKIIDNPAESNQKVSEITSWENQNDIIQRYGPEGLKYFEQSMNNAKEAQTLPVVGDTQTDL